VLFASDKPLPPAKINEITQIGGVRSVRSAVEQLNARYDQTRAAFRIVHVAGGYQMQTLPEYAGVLARLVKSREESRLSQAAMETLAIVAYRQPVLRADVEAIRGVATGEVLHRLMELNLAKIVGRAEELGRPLLYGTTKHFLEIFGLGSLEDLPNLQQLKAPPATRKPAEKPAEPAAPEGQTQQPHAESQQQAQEQAPPPAAGQPASQPDESAGTGEPAVPDAQADGAGEIAPDLPADESEDHGQSES
jgi:segregation and condensation protein B